MLWCWKDRKGREEMEAEKEINTGGKRQGSIDRWRDTDWRVPQFPLLPLNEFMALRQLDMGETNQLFSV